MFDPQAIPEAPDPRTAEPSAPRVLVVEDDDSIRLLAARILVRNGFVVVQATNGREAIDVLERNGGIHVIVLDLAMPVLNGVEFIEHVRSHMPSMLDRIVVVTANVRAFRDHIPEGVCHVLTKPFDMQQFLEAVHLCTRRATG